MNLIFANLSIKALIQWRWRLFSNIFAWKSITQWMMKVSFKNSISTFRMWRTQSTFIFTCKKSQFAHICLNIGFKKQSTYQKRETTGMRFSALERLRVEQVQLKKRSIFCIILVRRCMTLTARSNWWGRGWSCKLKIILANRKEVSTSSSWSVRVGKN